MKKMQQYSILCILALTRAENIRAVRAKISSSWFSLFAGVSVFQFRSSVSIQIVCQMLYLTASDRLRWVSINLAVTLKQYRRIFN
jgi:hypothetical protein